MIRHPEFHGWRHPECLTNPTPVIEREEGRNRRVMAFQGFAKGEVLSNPRRRMVRRFSPAMDDSPRGAFSL